MSIEKTPAWTVRTYGEPAAVLRYEEMEVPAPGRDQVLVKVRHTSLNVIDLRMTQGYGRRLRKLVSGREFPFIAGKDLVGEVVEVGPGVNQFKCGDRVAGITGPKESGAFAQFVAVDAGHVVRVPTTVSGAELAAIPYVALTTWTALVTRAKLDLDEARGKRLLVHAGSGGVGSYAIQWARALGMKVVTTCGPTNVEWVKELGADQVVDYTREDYRVCVDPVDIAYDTLGFDHEDGTANLVKQGGKYVSIVHQLMPYTDKHGLVVGGGRAIGRLLRKKFLNRLKGRSFDWSVCQPSEKGLAQAMELVEAGSVRAVIDRLLPMTDIVEGYKQLATGRTKGKIVLEWTD